MPLVVSKVEDSDIGDYVRISLAGFYGDPVARIFQGCDINSPSAEIAALIERRRKTVIGQRNVNPIKVTDTDTGKVIAVAEWNYEPAKTPEKLEKIDIPDDASPALVAILKTYLGTGNEIMGDKPYWTLGNMVTHPDHRHRGAAGLLVQWGIDIIDRDGLEAYVDASADGKPLYERFGFEQLREVVYEYSDSDLNVRETHYCMLRKARPLVAKTGA
ncbi:hypothetical protein AOQ84DRAFT_342958 [Glonium stellatum]|uniref:N-acetyltransferase domain-containing protein n=1 Tax=Glonium stellatum TaxID=574774 RepID=A0A8E2JRR1_9PEZI|nr:hypothetical protein AOQ84DRAFT_342958 [Glonium stellatum]